MPSPRSRRSRLAVLAAVLTMTGGALAACGSSAAGTPAAAGGSSASAPTARYPVTVTSRGVPVTQDQAPKRAASTTSTPPRTCWRSGWSPGWLGDLRGDWRRGLAAPARPWAQYLPGFHQVPDVSSGYFTLG